MKLNSNELMKQRTPIKHLLSPENNLTTAVVAGWVKSYRDSKSVGFLMLNDGSCQQDLQVVIAKELLTPELSAQLLTGASFLAQGTWVTSVGQKQQGELQASQLILVGAVDPSYPLQKKATSLEFLREQAHLRGRTNTIAAVLRIRHLLSMATHQFFDQKGYYYVHTPIISSSDCEGAGEMFRVTTLDPVALAKEKKPVQWDQDYFAQATYLAVSGQLQGEALAMGLGGIYTFGPTFRSENSHTSRHLSEFWMIEPEVAFCQLDQLATLAADYLCYCLKEVLQKAPVELQFFEQHYQPQLRANLEQVVQGKFLRITYTEAVDILLASKKQFTYPVSWGADLQSEHERYLTDEHFKSPVIVTHYPKELKSFYMRLEDDGKTVRAMDVLVPGIGEVIGGSEREERYDVLLERMKEKGLSQAEYQWYLDLRRFGGVPHAGFGLGLERLVMYATGISNIRDVIPFPRFPQSAKF